MLRKLRKLCQVTLYDIRVDYVHIIDTKLIYFGGGFIAHAC